MIKRRQRLLCSLAAMVLMTACASTGTVEIPEPPGRLSCDTILIYEMCVQDVSGDGRVDLMYFSDTMEIFMYREGMENQVTRVLPLHRCAVPMDVSTIEYSSQLLNSQDLTLVAEMDVKGRLLVSYLAAKPAVDACYAENDMVSESFGDEEDYDWSFD